MEKAKLLEVRKEKNKRRPKFLRQDYHHRKKVQDDLWRSPKGYHSKMRSRKRGHRAKVVIGYRNPVDVRGLHRSGAEFVYVRNVADLANVHPAHHVAILSAGVGDRKKYAILKASQQQKIVFVNADAAKFIAAIDAKLKVKKDAKVAVTTAKAKPAEKPKAEAPKTEAKLQHPKPETKTATPKTGAKQ